MGRLVGLVLNLLEGLFGDDKPLENKDVEKDGVDNDTRPRVHRQHSGVNEHSGKKARFMGLFQMLNREKRAGMALGVAMAWSASIILIGIIFTILCATGTFPATVAEMKAVGIYVEYQVKYALYVVGAVVGMAGVIMVYKAVRNARSPTLGLFMLWVAMLIGLGTIGITIYLVTKDAQLNVEWWSYLIQAFILVMRIALVLSLAAAIVAVHEAQRDDWARQEMIKGRY